jgi:SAM-dependent methyltransferase
VLALEHEALDVRTLARVGLVAPMLDRELRLTALLDVVEAVAWPRPLVLDLGCGTGPISRRLLERLPRPVRSVDVDPALLTTARATLDDARLRLVRADTADPAWVGQLPETLVDAVLTATALHWLPEPLLRHVYRTWPASFVPPACSLTPTRGTPRPATAGRGPRGPGRLAARRSAKVHD